MASPVKLYQSEMHANLGFFATWLPGDPIEIGDAGVLIDGTFRHMSSLRELGIGVQLEEGGSAQDIRYNSTSGSSLDFSAGADVGGVAKAEIKIDFSRQGAFVFHAAGLRSRRLSNRAEVARHLLRAHSAGNWQTTWFLVEALHATELATIVVSEGGASGITLTADLTSVAIPSVSLADPKIKLAVASTRGKVVHVVGAKDLRPLYSCLRVEDPLFGRPKVKPVRGAAGPDDEPTFVRPSISDLLES